MTAEPAPEPTVPVELLAAFAMPGARLSQLPGGRMNRHWVATAGARTLVFRRYNALRLSDAIEWEHRLLGHTAAKGWPVPVPLPCPSGTTIIEAGDGLWAAMPFLDGFPQDAGSPGAYHVMGRLLGRLHNDIAGFLDQGQRPGFGKTWELDVGVETAGEASFNALLSAFGRDYPNLAGLVRRERYRNLRELARLHYPDLPDRPIHGDFHRSNLLFTGGQLTGLLDFDQCRLDALACDIAPLLVPFEPLELRRASALLEGYQAVRPLSETEWDLLPALGRASLLWWVTFLLITWRTTGSEIAVQGVSRTMKERFPAFDAWEPEFRSLRAPRPGAGR